jgi:hypothetical protein
MDTILKGIKNASPYIDDVIIFSQDFESHLEHIKQELERLQRANYKVKTTKCRFSFIELEFLSYIVSEKGIEIDDQRIRSIKEYPSPKNKKEVKFLG